MNRRQFLKKGACAVAAVAAGGAAVAANTTTWSGDFFLGMDMASGPDSFAVTLLSRGKVVATLRAKDLRVEFSVKDDVRSGARLILDQQSIPVEVLGRINAFRDEGHTPAGAKHGA